MAAISSLDSQSGKTIQKIPLIAAQMLWQTRVTTGWHWSSLKDDLHGACHPECVEAFAENIMCEEHGEGYCGRLSSCRNGLHKCSGLTEDADGPGEQQRVQCCTLEDRLQLRSADDLAVSLHNDNLRCDRIFRQLFFIFRRFLHRTVVPRVLTFDAGAALVRRCVIVYRNRSCACEVIISWLLDGGGTSASCERIHRPTGRCLLASDTNTVISPEKSSPVRPLQTAE